jgi:hypothetical protein
MRSMIIDTYTVTDTCLNDTTVKADSKYIGLYSGWNRINSGFGRVWVTYLKVNILLGLDRAKWAPRGRAGRVKLKKFGPSRPLARSIVRIVDPTGLQCIYRSESINKVNLSTASTQLLGQVTVSNNSTNSVMKIGVLHVQICSNAVLSSWVHNGYIAELPSDGK